MAKLVVLLHDWIKRLAGYISSVSSDLRETRRSHCISLCIHLHQAASEFKHYCVNCYFCISTSLEHFGNRPIYSSSPNFNHSPAASTILIDVIIMDAWVMLSFWLFSPWLFTSLSSIWGFLDPSPSQMGYHNKDVQQLKADKRLSVEALGQAPLHTPRSDTKRDQSFLYWRYFPVAKARSSDDSVLS